MKTFSYNVTQKDIQQSIFINKIRQFFLFFNFFNLSQKKSCNKQIIQFFMNPSRLKNQYKSFQQLLADELIAQTQLAELNQKIFALQNKVIGQNWWDGNFIIKWSRYLNQQKNHQLNLLPKDRVFSISDIASGPSSQILNIANAVLDRNEVYAKNDARKYLLDKNRKFKPVSKKDKKQVISRKKELAKSKKNVKKSKRIKRRNKMRNKIPIRQ